MDSLETEQLLLQLRHLKFSEAFGALFADFDGDGLVGGP